MTNTTCAECGSEITISNDVESGEILDCDICGIELEVIEVDPIELSKAPELEEDWGE
jgi:alpha-aminoadipate carrier protein LysW